MLKCDVLNASQVIGIQSTTTLGIVTGFNRKGFSSFFILWDMHHFIQCHDPTQQPLKQKFLKFVSLCKLLNLDHKSTF